MASYCCYRHSFFNIRLKYYCTRRHIHASNIHKASLATESHDVSALSTQLRSKGYAKTLHPLLTHQTCQLVKERMPKLFRGEFDTGIYPDEWHWREGISRPDAAREMCNSWKSDRLIASIVLNEKLGQFIAQVMGWESVRIAQDDLVWKPPSSTAAATFTRSSERRIDTVGFHQDSAYISTQFEPYENNSVTLWMALDDADEETGCVEYAVGSHKWRPILHKGGTTTQYDSSNTDNTAADLNSEISSFHSSDETSYRDGLALAARLAGVSVTDKIELAPAREGYAILHDQDCWHGSGPNQSCTRHRRALVAHYIRGDVTFSECVNKKDSGPFGHATYIYGRYKRYHSVEVDESYFPIIYGERRTAWIDDFVSHESM